MWRQFMVQAHRGVPAERFPEADEELVRVRVDASGNCLPSDEVPSGTVRTKTYLKGAEPTEECKAAVNKDVDATPNVIGLSGGDARGILTREGFFVRTISQYCPAYSIGDVCDQNPRPGEDAAYGSEAIIYVSSSGIDSEVPRVIGVSVARAKEKLADAGYRVDVVRRSNDGTYDGCSDPYEDGDGRVWAQSPCDGSSLGRGKTVTIYVNP
jgi:hypothetical protein